MALVEGYHENQNKAKHVESIFIPCLDEGSIPSSSTTYTENQQVTINQELFQGLLGKKFLYSIKSGTTGLRIIF